LASSDTERMVAGPLQVIYDLLDALVMREEPANTYSPEIEAKIRSHPVIVREVSRQERDIADALIDERIDLVWDRLNARARAENDIFVGLRLGPVDVQT